MMARMQIKCPPWLPEYMEDDYIDIRRTLDFFAPEKKYCQFRAIVWDMYWRVHGGQGRRNEVTWNRIIKKLGYVRDWGWCNRKDIP